jgi:hypothetical protein
MCLGMYVYVCIYIDIFIFSFDLVGNVLFNILYFYLSSSSFTLRMKKNYSLHKRIIRHNYLYTRDTHLGALIYFLF